MLYFAKESFWTLIFYILALNLQWVLAVTLPLDIRERSIYYLTTTKDVTIILKEPFTLAINLDSSSTLSTTQRTSSAASSGVFIAKTNSITKISATASP